MSARTERYVERLATAYGIKEYAVLPGGTVVYAAYRDGSYELCTTDGRLTATDGDLTFPQWHAGRGTVHALRDGGGREQYDLVEADPDTGAVSSLLDDEFRNTQPRPSPRDDDLLAFVSNRDRSLDLYTLRIGEETVTKRSVTHESVVSHAWAPDGQRLVYEAGRFEGSALRVVDLTAGTDEVLVDEPDSEQSLAEGGAWSAEGIVFTTNHETGYRELAVGDGNGDYEIRDADERDKYDARWAEGDVLFTRSRGGHRALCRLSDGEVTTVERSGRNDAAQIHDGTVHYVHRDTGTVGDLYRDGDPLVREGSVDVLTVAPEEVTYESADGRDVAARLYTPDGDPIGGVVKVHGGPAAQHFADLDPVVQSLVRAGFEVIAPDYRGSTGYGRAFRKASDGDVGGGDLEDVVAAADYLRDRGRAEVGVVGGSYGGYLSLMGVGATDAFDAGASACGIVDWRTALENAHGYVGDFFVRKVGGTPEERPDLYAERSPITYVDDVDCPLLVVQGANDPRVPESQAEQLLASLDERGIPCEYVRFEDEGHGVRRTDNRIEYVTRVVSFFESALADR